MLINNLKQLTINKITISKHKVTLINLIYNLIAWIQQIQQKLHIHNNINQIIHQQEIIKIMITTIININQVYILPILKSITKNQIIQATILLTSIKQILINQLNLNLNKIIESKILINKNIKNILKKRF